MASLPAGKFYLLSRCATDDDVALPIFDRGDGCACIAFFSDRRRAQAYRRVLEGPRWDLSRLSRAELLEWLGQVHQNGITYAALDPTPGRLGAGGPIFSMLVDSL